MNVWTRVGWEEDLGCWRADLPTFGGWAKGATVQEAADEAREFVASSLRLGKPPATTPNWDTRIGGTLVRGRVILPHQLIDAVSTNDTVIIGFRVVGKAVTPPMLIVVATLIDDLFG